jgi:hypothetical protein
MAAFPSLRTDVQWHFAVEPGPRPASCPPVLQGDRELHPASLVPLRVKVHATELRGLDSSIHIHLLWLIMEFITLHEAIARGSTLENT